MTRLSILRLLGLLFVALIVAGSVLGIIVPRGMALDFANFYDAGHKASVGQFASLYDPFALIAGNQPVGNMTFVSLPITSYFYLPFARFEPEFAMVLFKVQSTIFIWGSLALLYFHLRRFVQPDPEQQMQFFAIFAGAALLFQPFWTVYRVGGQTTPLVFFLLVAGLIAFSRNKSWATAACYVLVVLIKPIFAPGLLLLFIFSGKQFRISSALFSAAAAAGSFLWLGWDVHMTFLSVLTTEGQGFNTPYYNSNMFAWVELVLLGNVELSSVDTLPGTIVAVALALRLATIGGLVWMLVSLGRSGAPDAAKRHFAFCISMIAPMIFSPVVWAHYVAVFFVPLMYMAANYRHFPRPALIILGLGTLFALSQNLMLVNKLGNRFGFDTWGEVFLMTGAKNATMLAIVGVMLVYRARYLETYQKSAWL